MELVLCINDKVYGKYPHNLVKGKTYVVEDRWKCECGGNGLVKVVGGQFLSPLPPEPKKYWCKLCMRPLTGIHRMDRWFWERRFVPLNDPDYKDTDITEDKPLEVVT